MLWESADIDDLISKKGTAGLFIRWCLFGYKDRKKQRQHRTIPALRLKHRSGSCRISLAVSALRIMRYCPKRVNRLSQCLFYFCYNMPGGAVNKYGYSTFCLRKALGVMPFSFRNTRLKLRMVPKPHCSATWVMGRLLPCSSAAAWLMRYWLIKS